MFEGVSKVPIINLAMSISKVKVSSGWKVLFQPVVRLDGEAGSRISTANKKLELGRSLAIRQFVNTDDKAYAELAQTFSYLMLKVSFS